MEGGEECPRGNEERSFGIVNGDTVYLNPSGTHKVYRYSNVQGNEQWIELLDNPSDRFGLAVVDGLLSQVWAVGNMANMADPLTLSSVSREKAQESRGLTSSLPCPHHVAISLASLHIRLYIVVAGGFDGIRYLDTVEVMNTDTTRVASLPEMCYSLTVTVTVFGDRLYFAGGFIGSSKSVFTCSLSALLTYNTLGSRLRRSLISSRQNVLEKKQ